MTPSELHVARLAAAGLSNADIARVRGSSVRTVANQMASVLRQLGVASRRALATLADFTRDLPSASDADWRTLSGRERDVLEMVTAGTPQKVIALELGLAPSTICEALRSTRERLGFGTFADLARAYRAMPAAA